MGDRKSSNPPARGLDWEDDTEHTRITDSKRLVREQGAESVRDRAYLILLTGSDAGQIFKLSQGETIIGRGARAAVKLTDDSISRHHFRIQLNGTQVELEDLESANGTFVNGEKVTRAALKDGDKLRVGDTTILKFSFHDRFDESFQKQMYDAALRDGLTRAYNKRHFSDQLEKELRYAQRHGTPLALIMIDLDHFKQVNDQYGHLAGDDVLVQVTRLSLAMIRTEDVFARYGGEEFGLIIRNTLEQAGVLAERMRATVAAYEFQSQGRSLRCSVSIGVAAFERHMKEPNELVESADGALYAAKHGGRNRVILKYPPPA